MELRFILSQKDEKMLSLNGYLYNRKSNNKSSITWRCNMSSKLRCSIIVHTTSDKPSGKIIGDVPEHDHAADITHVECKKLKANIKKSAKRCNDNPVAVIAGASSNLLSPVAARLLKTESMARTVQRVRQKEKPQMCNPQTLSELNILAECVLSNKGEMFLLDDSGGGDDRFLIFATWKNLDTLGKCKQWAADGTFSAVPTIFKQLYTIHGMKKDKILLLVYLLTPSKSKSMYDKFLKVLLNKRSDLKPERIMIDYELAFIKVFKKHFLSTVISRCLFHYSQCIWRHVQFCGLQKNYNTDVKLALEIRKLMALAFVPPEDVVDAFEELMSSDYYDAKEILLKELITYFERTWIGLRSRSGRRRENSVSDVALWNCYHAILNDEGTSNNAVKGWHHAFNGRIKVVHATISRFLEALKIEQNITDLQIIQLDTGVQVAAKRRKVYCSINERLKHVVSDYDANDQITYLKNIALIYSMNHS